MTPRLPNNIPLRLLAALLAMGCGPASPAEPDTGTTADEAPTTTSTSSAPTTGTDAPTTTTTSSTTSTSTTSDDTSASSSGPADGGVCIADPAEGICSESCDWGRDCCQCEGKRLHPEDAVACTVAMGIVTGRCPWSVTGVYWDGEYDSNWSESEVNGDIVVEFLGDACTKLLARDFTEIYIEVYCEAA